MELLADMLEILQAIDEALVKNDVNTALKKTHEGLARCANEKVDNEPESLLSMSSVQGNE